MFKLEQSWYFQLIKITYLTNCHTYRQCFITLISDTKGSFLWQQVQIVALTSYSQSQKLKLNPIQHDGGDIYPQGFFYFQAQNQGLSVKQCTTLKYRQLQKNRKKIGPIPPKLGPYRGNKDFRQNVENRDSAQEACFQEF